MKNNLIGLIAILIISFSVSLPLTRGGLFTMHDDQQVVRLYLFDKALKGGQFPVRWVDELGFGFGYPLFNFYPPLVYAIGEAYHLMGFGFIDSVKLVFFSSILFSAIAMYIFVKELSGKFPAVVSAIFYIAAPYRALDIYIRGALAESFSFVWLPLILWSYYKLFKTSQTSYVLLSAILLALLMVTHNLIFLPFILILPFYILLLLYQSNKKTVFFKKIVISALFAAGISVFFWAPALFEKRFTIVDDLLLVNLANYNIHFVYPQQLWNWTWGFGGSAEGLADGISFKIGKLHILTSLAAFALSFIYLFNAKRLSRLSVVTFQKETFSRQLSVIFSLLFIFSAYMTTQYSKFIWDLFKPLQYLQFPWRFLIFTAFFSSILAGSFIYYLRLTVFKLLVGSILIILLTVPNLKLFKPQDFRSYLTDDLATSESLINWDISSSSFEYLLKGVDMYTGKLGTNIVNIQKENIPNTKVEVINGNTTISDLKETPHEITFKANSASSSLIQANLFNFPGWKVKINDKIVQINDDNRLKLITFKLEQGENSVEIKFENTFTRSLANLLSVITIAVIFFAFVYKWQILKNN